MAFETDTELSTRGESDTELHDVKDRLVKEYGGGANLGEESIHRAVDAAAARFSGASVRSFVPILVERAVRIQLSAMRASSV